MPPSAIIQKASIQRHKHLGHFKLTTSRGGHHLMCQPVQNSVYNIYDSPVDEGRLPCWVITN